MANRTLCQILDSLFAKSNRLYLAEMQSRDVAQEFVFEVHTIKQTDIRLKDIEPKR